VKPKPVKVEEKEPEKKVDAMDDVLAGIDFGEEEEEEIKEKDRFLNEDGSLNDKEVDFGLISRLIQEAPGLWAKIKQNPKLYSTFAENPEEKIYEWIDKNVKKEAPVVNGPRDTAGP